jgi:hypothetical protein
MLPSAENGSQGLLAHLVYGHHSMSMATHGEMDMSWEEIRIMQHVMTVSRLPKWSEPSAQTVDPWFDRVDQAYRGRAIYLHGFQPVFNQIGVSPGELKLTHEPVHPLSHAQLKAVVTERLRAMGATHYPEDHGFAVVSRALLDILFPAADLLSLVRVPENLPDLLLFDPLLGMIIWREDERIRNAWLGGLTEMTALMQMDPQIARILVPHREDVFRIGATLLSGAIPTLRHPWPIKPDESLIPSVTVANQAELDALAADLRDACARFKIPITLVFRGQTKEHRVPDRSALVQAGICPFANLRDHSLVPSLYRHYDAHLDDLEQFRAFMAHLLDWGLYSDMVFGEPAQYFTLGGEPYVPKTGPATARVSAAMAFTGETPGNPMFEDLGPTSRFTVYDAANNVIDEYVKVHRPGQDAARRALVLQHYGAPTPFVDVTRDIRVAEWFAVNRLQIGPEGITDTHPVESMSGDPVIFALLVPAGMGSFANTDELVEEAQSPRPHRQAGAVIGGIGNLYRNAVSRFVGLKIKFAEGFKPEGLPTAEYLFPGPEEDPALKKLLASYRPSKDLRKPFPVYWLSGK